MKCITDPSEMLSETMAKSMQTMAHCINFSQPQVPVMQIFRRPPQLNSM